MVARGVPARRRVSCCLAAAAWLWCAAAFIPRPALAAPAPAAVRADHRSLRIVIHVRDLAGDKLWYVRRVDRAVQYQVNHQVHRIWHTPLIRFDAPSTRPGPANSWLVDVTPGPTVMYGFFTSPTVFTSPIFPCISRSRGVPGFCRCH